MQAKHMYKKIIIPLLGAIFASGCSDEPTKSTGAVNPEIISLRIDNKWNLNATDSNLVEVKVTDPQGFGDLKNVVVKVFDSANQLVFEDSLYDDGGSGGTTDLIAGDGIFRNLFLPKTVTDSSEGDYTFDFEIKDKANNSGGELKKDVTFAFNEAPAIINVVAPSQLLSGAETEFVYVTALDQDGTNQETKVFLYILQNEITVDTRSISNDGNTAESGDLFANDSIFSFKMDSSFAAKKIGDYKMKFVAVDEFGDESVEIVKDIFIENKVGQILSVEMPDTVTRPADIQIKVKVNDPQGDADIDKVYFELQAPDGKFILDGKGEHQQFPLYNDGEPFHGDESDIDLIYSVILKVTEKNAADTYTFYFNMIDWAKNTSNVITDTLTIE